MIYSLALAALLIPSPASPQFPLSTELSASYAKEALSDKLTVEFRTSTIKNLIKELNATYVDVAIAAKIEKELTKWMETSEFNKLDDPREFTAKVNEILISQVTDAHLRFRYSANALPPRENPREPSEAEIKEERQWVKRQNSLFHKVERLEGNIGYFAFNMFLGQDDVKRPMAAVMNFLSDTDAMIIDLRQNGGGHPEGVQMVCSYFFGEKPVHLNSLYFREGNQTVDFYTLDKLDAPRFLDKPVYVLVSKRTGSGAEECAYNLQQLKRATIIGEPTWGGANPGGVVRLNDHFSCFIPVGKAVNPYTKTNWEGKGVIPDLAVAPDKSLNFAHQLAIQDLLKKEADSEYRTALQDLLKKLSALNPQILKSNVIMERFVS